MAAEPPRGSALGQEEGRGGKGGPWGSKAWDTQGVLSQEQECVQEEPGHAQGGGGSWRGLIGKCPLPYSGSCYIPALLVLDLAV